MLGRSEELSTWTAGSMMGRSIMYDAIMNEIADVINHLPLSYKSCCSMLK